MWQKMLQSGSGGGSKLDTFATLNLKTKESTLAGQQIVCTLDTNASASLSVPYIVTTNFSNTVDSNGFYNATVKLQSLGDYAITCDVVKKKFTVSDFIDYSTELVKEVPYYIITFSGGGTPYFTIVKKDMLTDNILKAQEQKNYTIESQGGFTYDDVFVNYKTISAGNANWILQNVSGGDMCYATSKAGISNPTSATKFTSMSFAYSTVVTYYLRTY